LREVWKAQAFHDPFSIGVVDVAELEELARELGHQAHHGFNQDCAGFVYFWRSRVFVHPALWRAVEVFDGAAVALAEVRSEPASPVGEKVVDLGVLGRDGLLHMPMIGSDSEKANGGT